MKSEPISKSLLVPIMKAIYEINTQVIWLCIAHYLSSPRTLRAKYTHTKTKWRF